MNSGVVTGRIVSVNTKISPPEFWVTPEAQHETPRMSLRFIPVRKLSSSNVAAFMKCVQSMEDKSLRVSVSFYPSTNDPRGDRICNTIESNPILIKK